VDEGLNAAITRVMPLIAARRRLPSPQPLCGIVKLIVTTVVNSARRTSSLVWIILGTP